MTSVSRTRLVLGGAGVLLGLFGIFRLLTQIGGSDLISLAVWLIAAVVLHDGVLAPITAGVGWGLDRVVPPRARRAVVYGLTGAVAVTVIALPEIYRRGSQPSAKALLQQNYGGHLAVALGIVAAVALVTYAISVVSDRAKPRPSATNARPSEDQVSSSE